LFQITQYPGGNSTHAWSINARDGAGIDQPALSAVDISLYTNMRVVAMAVADQIMVAGAGPGMVRHVRDKYPAPPKYQHCFLTMVGEQTFGLCHRAVQSGNVADVVAMHCMDGNAKLEGCTQGIYTDQVATMYTACAPAALASTIASTSGSERS
jgi:hypothetical protein